MQNQSSILALPQVDSAFLGKKKKKAEVQKTKQKSCVKYTTYYRWTPACGLILGIINRLLVN